MTQERVNNVITKEGKYTGYSVNMPFVVGQADSLEELNAAMKDMMTAYISYLIQMINELDEPFEFKQVDGNTFLNYDPKKETQK
jgi:predicted RNase H-like HicB family nuclease